MLRINVEKTDQKELQIWRLFTWCGRHWNSGWHWSEINWALSLSWRRFLPYRNQTIDLLCKSIDWFLYDIGFRHERVKGWNGLNFYKVFVRETVAQFCKIHSPKLLLVFQENNFGGTLLKTFAVSTCFLIETLFFCLVAIYSKF